MEQVKAETDATLSEAEVIAAQEEVKRILKDLKEVCRQVKGSSPVQAEDNTKSLHTQKRLNSRGKVVQVEVAKRQGGAREARQ